jgi:alkylated DNA repair dioxygenase AlkB
VPLFSTNGAHQLAMENAEVSYFAQFYDAAQSQLLRQQLLQEISWDTHFVNMFGKSMPSPRRSSWHGDAHCHYTYSNVRYAPKAWTPLLQAVREKLALANLGQFNCVLANHYRDGSDSMGWHSDDERELGSNPVIASVSFGASRTFCFRSRSGGERVDLTLADGSLLLMAGATQSHWQHALPKTKVVSSDRVNLTFRWIA